MNLPNVNGLDARWEALAARLQTVDFDEADGLLEQMADVDQAIEAEAQDLIEAMPLGLRRAIGRHWLRGLGEVERSLELI
jgi:hypothetical protein